MDNRKVTSGRFFSRKNLFSPPRLVLFLVMLLWGLVPYTASANLVFEDNEGETTNATVEWYKERAAFKITMKLSEQSGYWDVVTSANWFVNGQHWACAWANDAKGNTFVRSLIDQSIGYVYSDTPRWTPVAQYDWASCGSETIVFWFYPKDPDQHFTIRLDYVIEEPGDYFGHTRTGSVTKYEGTPALYDYKVSFDASFPSNGEVPVSLSVSNTGKYSRQSTDFILQQSFDDGKNYLDYTTRYDDTSWSYSSSINCYHDNELITAQQFANGVWIRGVAATDPDEGSGDYVYRSYSQAYHTGATQAFDDRYLSVVQNSRDIDLKWKVLMPIGSQASKQDMSDYQIERKIDNGDWEFVANVPTNTTISTYTYTYTIPDDELLQGTKNYAFRVWKKRYENVAVRSHFMCSDVRYLPVNTNYRTLTIKNLEPNTSSQMAVVNWTTSDNGAWDSDVKIVAEVTNTTSGGTTEYTASYNATTMNLTGLQGCNSYTVKLLVKVGGVVLSETAELSLQMPDDGERRIENFIASKGYYNTYVRLTWDVPADATDFTHFNIVRKNVATGVSSNVEQITHSGLLSYNYQDYGMDAGVLYEYMVEGYSTCEGEATLGASKTDMGFSQPYAKASGNIAYSGSQAVEGVAVSAIASDASSEKNRSLYFDGQDKSSNVMMPGDLIDFSTSDAYTLQFWVNPSMQADAVAESGVYLLSKRQTMDLMLYDTSASGGKKNSIYIYLLGKSETTSTALPQNEWSHITYSAKINSELTEGYAKLYVNGVLEEEATFAIDSVRLNDFKHSPLMVGGNSAGDGGFKGYMDEIRIYNVDLDSATIAKTYNLYLSGKEDNLMAYYRCDEEGSSKLFDLAATGSNYHMYDAEIRPMATFSREVPSAEQLSIKTYTDIDGNYLLNTIPYTSEGIQYNIVSTLGIHKFTPNKRPIYVSPESVVFNNVDFEDTSSFPVSGIIYYDGTDVPVEGVELYVDGVVCTKDGDLIKTNEEGKFEISVPIGNHHITVKKAGHTFAYNGRFPEDAKNIGVKHTFDQELSGLTFYDKTLVNVTGRVVGGEIESNKPLGLKQSKNNIGTASIVLSHGNYRLNVVDVKNGTTVEKVENSKNVDIASATANINSYAFRAGGNNEDVRYIHIATDSVTGEFSAMLPPLAYTIEEVKVPTNAAIEIDNLPRIDASNPMAENTDSITNEEGSVERYKYCTSTILTVRNEPSFTVTDKGNMVGAFGSSSMKYSDLTTKEDVALYTENEGVVEYSFGVPIFVKGTTYNFDLYGYEEYVNNDGEAPVSDKVPLQNSVVTITNEMSNGQAVYVEDGTVDGKEVSQGDFADLKSNQLQLDSVGKAVYTWTAGFPNITEPYKRGISIVYDVAGENIPWSGNETFEAIVLGDMPSGNNFVTSGPDEIMMILRDPAGSNSTAFWEAGQTITKETTHSGTGSIASETSATVSLGSENTVIVGTPGIGLITQIGNVFDTEIGISLTSTVTGRGESSTTLTTTKRVSTSESSDYVGAHADVFIGTATNIIFGNARNVGLTRDVATGKYDIGLEDVLTTSTSFGTAFNYTQYYIENILIPNLYLNRDALLQTVASTSGITNRDSKDPIYITTISKEDERFGSKNTDKDVWGSQASSLNTSLDGPSYKMLLPTGSNYDDSMVYQDMVLWYNTQIEMWEQAMADNEKAKLTAIGSRETYLSENLSFDAGAFVESSVTSCTAESMTQEWEFETSLYANIEAGFDVNETGVTVKNSTTNKAVYAGSNSDGSENCSTTGFSLAEDGYNDALSLDVFNAPDGYGAIFVTRGGQTSCPYESAVHTQYYKPGTEISAATMQIEIPIIESDKYFATDVPAGGVASYELSLRNDSETGDDIWFDLKVVDATNANGASLSVDGSKLTESGRGMLVPAGGTLTKTLQLRQTELDVLDYEDIAVVLVSQCQSDPTGIFPVVADTIYLSAQFVPTCSNITLDIPETTLNMFTSDTLTLQMKDFDRDYNTFESIRLQYKYANDANWTRVKTYVLDEAKVDEDKDIELLPTGGVVTVKLPMSSSAGFHDGVYQFRLQTTCAFGVDGVYTNSNVITVTKDMVAPASLGTPNPSDGILSAGDDVSLTFNENIRSGELKEAENFFVTGILNDAVIDHAVALRLDGTATPVATTEADVHLANSSFAVDMWLNYTEAGTLFEHGTADNKFVMAINEAGKLVVTIGADTFTSEGVIPSDNWCYLTLNYTDAEYNLLTALVASEATSISLFESKVVPDYTGTGTIAIGEDLVGAMQEVTLWNRARTTIEAQSEMYVGKSASTPNLVGYWKLNEGHGTSAVDAARSRHLTLANETWYLNNDNLAATLDGEAHLALNISTTSVANSDNYMFEMWFKGEEQTDATLWSINDNAFGMRFNDKGMLALVVADDEIEISSTNYLDNVWHHVALNVLRNGTTTIYVDGTAVKQLSSTLVPAMQSDAIIVGACRSRIVTGEGGYSFASHFTGEVDEIRFWSATVNGEFIVNNMYNRIDPALVSGLVGYYPFEIESLDAANQVITTFTLADFSENNLGDATSVGAAESASAPALQAAPSLTNIQFSYVASEREIVIDVLEDAYRIEGTTLNFTVKNVRDENDNLIQPIAWSAFVNCNRLVWDESKVAYTVTNGESQTFTATISNQGAEGENWTMTNLPTWLTTDQTEGYLAPLSSQKVTFTISSATNIGSYEETIYLSGNEGIYTPMILSLKVAAEAPAWSVNPGDFESNMNIVGTVSILDAISYDADDIIAAFNGDVCVGIASPKYFSRYDAYYTVMTLYGNAADNGSANITFKIWDASTGTTYPAVSTSEEVVFVANDLLGGYRTPFTWNAEDYIEQSTAMTTGWNWISLSVAPQSNAIGNVFGSINDNAHLAKGHSTFSEMASDSWNGTLTDIELGKMYRVQMNNNDMLEVTGLIVDQPATSIDIATGWNWIGYTAMYSLGIDEAFADANPQTDDMVKSLTGFAIYEGYEWVGTLTSLQPGMGYMYYNSTGAAKEFSYPSSSIYAKHTLKSVAPRANSSFNTIDPGLYSSNMTMIAVVMDGADIASGADVGVFADKECRAAQVADAKGVVYLTILGDGVGSDLKFHVVYNGEDYEIDQELIFFDNQHHGSVNEPYVIQLDETYDGIENSNNNAFAVYLDAAVDKAYIETTIDFVSAKVYDMQGTTLYESEDTTVIDFAGFSDGVYFVVLTDEDGKMYTEKLVKN